MILFYNGFIHVMDSENYVCDSLLIKGNKIEVVGTEDECEDALDGVPEAAITRIDLKGKVLLPAFIDTHTHFFELARMNIAVDLFPAESLEDVKVILLEFKKSMPSNLKWVRGSGWNKNIYPSLEGFDKYLLDEIFPDIPVSFESKDFHSKWCNSLALERAGIYNNTPNPEGGMIGHFSNGELNGFIHEKAWTLIDSVIPPVPLDLAEKAVLETIKECYSYGLAGVHSMEGEDKFKIYSKLVNSGAKFRFCWNFPSEMIDSIITQGITSFSGTELLKYGSQKIFMDGALGSQTALMYEPYTGTDNYGTSIYSPEKLLEMINRAAKHNISSAIHAIGDKCCHQVISAIAESKKSYPNLQHRVEHLQCVRPEEYNVIKENEIYIAVQPIHIRYDIKTIQKLWKSVEQYTYNFQDLIDEGLSVGYGSDAPVELINPFQGIYAAITRKYKNEPNNPSWRSEQCVSVMNAIRAYTCWAAKASQSEEVRGQIKEGFLADIIVIDNFNNKPDEFWLTAKSHLTMVDGEIVLNELF